MIKIQISTDSKNLDTTSFHSPCELALKKFRARQDIGFSFLPDRQELWTSTKLVGDKLLEKFSKFVVVGIGGSSLGGLAIAESLSKDNVLFLDNVDGEYFDKILKSAGDLKKVGWVFISKSGTTIETLATLDLVEQIYHEQNLKLPLHSAVITEDKASSLKKWAEKNQVPTLEIPLDVGGRFSVLSPVGMLPAHLMGLSIDGFNKGAQQALDSSGVITDLMSTFAQSFSREEWITLFWFYNSKMKSFGGWLQQLWCESLAKKVDLTGNPGPRVSTAMWAIGACDQHSILQQVMEGHKDKFVVFWRFAGSEAGTVTLKKSQFPETELLVGKTLGQLLGVEARATCQGLINSGVSAMTLQSPAMDEKSLGYLFMAMQLVVAGLGEYLNINTFNQPGVEIGKILAKKILKEG